MAAARSRIESKSSEKEVESKSDSTSSSIPVLLVHGTKDRVLEPELAYETEKVLSSDTFGKGRFKTTLEILEGLGHRFCEDEFECAIRAKCVV